LYQTGWNLDAATAPNVPLWLFRGKPEDVSVAITTGFGCNPSSGAWTNWKSGKRRRKQIASTGDYTPRDQIVYWGLFVNSLELVL
jgi:hypothetical protein